jgi:hypothetical protein
MGSRGLHQFSLGIGNVKAGDGCLLSFGGYSRTVCGFFVEGDGGTPVASTCESKVKEMS